MHYSSPILLTAFLLTACVGEHRETTTARTATEMLAVSTAAQRAIRAYDPGPLSGRRVAIDDGRFDGIDKSYVMSSLRNHLARHGVIVVGKDDEPDLVLEIRNGTLGINDDSFGIGIPPLPVPVPETEITSALPPLYLFFKDEQEGWAKFQIWVYDPKTMAYVSGSKDLWGRSEYIRWWIFFLGPFEFGTDIFPDEEEVEVDD